MIRSRWKPLAAALPVAVVLTLVGLAAAGIIGPNVAAAAVLILVLGAIVVGVFKLAMGPLSRAIARRQVSIRWKITVALSIIGGLVLFSTVVNFFAMEHMHEQLHRILDMEGAAANALLLAVIDLEQTTHGPFFELMPFIALLGGLLALAYGVAMARMTIDAIRSMEQGMQRFAMQDFSAPIVVENRDELGQLAQQMNEAAGDLAQAHEAHLAREREAALRERMAEVTLAQEEERRRISRELHDELGPSLAAIANRVRIARTLVASAPDEAERELGDVTTALTEEIGEIRKLIHGLRPLALDQLGLVGALRQNVERFGEEHGLRASFRAMEHVPLSPLAEITVLRVVQECLANVQKHARARNVDVALAVVSGRVRVTVEDDGRGFEPPDKNGDAGMGLLSIQERADLVHGILTIESRTGAGCRVALDIPLEESVDGAHPNPSR